MLHNKRAGGKRMEVFIRATYAIHHKEILKAYDTLRKGVIKASWSVIPSCTLLTRARAILKRKRWKLSGGSKELKECRLHDMINSKCTLANIFTFLR
jgi:hypothetical protein